MHVPLFPVDMSVPTYNYQLPQQQSFQVSDVETPYIQDVSELEVQTPSIGTETSWNAAADTDGMNGMFSNMQWSDGDQITDDVSSTDEGSNTDDVLITEEVLNTDEIMDQLSTMDWNDDGNEVESFAALITELDQQQQQAANDVTATEPETLPEFDADAFRPIGDLDDETFLDECMDWRGIASP